MSTHDDLLQRLTKLPSDFEPWGERQRDGPDCSVGCVYFVRLEGPLGDDWGVCVNQASPRHGLLTFEHQGCQHFTGPEDRLGPDNVRSVG